MPSETTETNPAAHKLALLFGRELATFEPEDLAEENLSVELALSLWMRKTGTDRAGLIPALLGLREALLDTSPLDAESEPIPLLPRHPAVAVRSLCTYLYGLIERASLAAGLGPVQLVEAALTARGRTEAPEEGTNHLPG